MHELLSSGKNFSLNVLDMEADTAENTKNWPEHCSFLNKEEQFC
jgi:hypothetical protein